MGRLIIIAGLVLIVVGILVMLGERTPWFGRLPGDITIRGKHTTFYFPLVTCLVISVILSLLSWLLGGRR